MSNNLYWIWGIGVSNTVALAAVAVIGYLFGRRSSAPAEEPTSSDEVTKAAAIAQQLESIAGGLRNDLAYHRTQVEKFKKQLRIASTEEEDDSWRRLREEAEAMLAPTLDLVGQLSNAYDSIRVQTQALTHFTGTRIDPLTGLLNGKALEEQLDTMLRSKPLRKGQSVCSVAMVSIEGVLPQDEDRQPPLEALAKALSQQLRGSDFAARYGTDELIVVMPKTPLKGACVFGRRLRASIEVQLGLQICIGLAEAAHGEETKSLLSRADAALYSARASQPGAVYLHNGAGIRPDQETQGAYQPAPEETVDLPASSEETVEELPQPAAN